MSSLSQDTSVWWYDVSLLTITRGTWRTYVVNAPAVAWSLLQTIDTVMNQAYLLHHLRTHLASVPSHYYTPHMRSTYCWGIRDDASTLHEPGRSSFAQHVVIRSDLVDYVTYTDPSIQANHQRHNCMCRLLTPVCKPSSCLKRQWWCEGLDPESSCLVGGAFRRLHDGSLWKMRLAQLHGYRVTKSSIALGLTSINSCKSVYSLC